MKLTLGLLAFSTYLVAIQCGLQTIVANPGGIGGIFKGPDSETIVKGPDGSIITSEQRGGIVQVEDKLEPIIVAESNIVEASSPILSPSLVEDGYIAPLVNVENVISIGEPEHIVPLEPAIKETVPVSSGHVVNIVEPEPHIIETEIIDAPAIESNESTDLVGPSGSISTRGSESIVSGPASTTITKTAKVLVAPPIISTKARIPQVITAVQNPSLLEVNNEIPAVSTTPLVTAIGSPTLQPLYVNGFTGPTLSPPIVTTPSSIAVSQPGPIFATGLLTGEQFNGRHQTPVIKTSTTVSPLLVEQSITPHGTPRVSVEDEGASGFINPGLVYSTGVVPSSTISPIFSSTARFYEGVPSSTISPVSLPGNIHTHHALNPSGIPSRNIIPPEIGVPQGTIDLSSSITSVTKEHAAPGVINVQGIDSDNIQKKEHINDYIQITDDDRIFQNGYYKTDILLGTNSNSVYPQQKITSLNVPLLTETNPILYQNVQHGVPQYLNNHQVLASSGSSEYNHNPHSDYNSAPTANFFNRYGRKRRNRKY